MKVKEADFEDEAIPKTYYKYELAKLYSISENTMASYIKRNEKLLAHTGYYRNQKKMTPKQVRILFEILGSPDISMI